jgi:Escherichia/Staphylococcus phage prohead protease
MMEHLGMEVRSFDQEQRLIMGIAVPYDETTYRVPGGERVKRGAFRQTVQQRGHKIPLLVQHAGKVMGYSTSFAEGSDGLEGTFKVNPGTLGDQVLEEVRDGYLPSMSVGFMPTRNGVIRASDGVSEVVDAKLVEVSLVGVPAYEGAAVLAVRSAQDLDALMAPFQNLPQWDLAPHDTFRYAPRRYS